MKTKSQPRYGGGRRLFPNRTPGTPRHRRPIAEGSQETRVNPIPRRATEVTHFPNAIPEGSRPTRDCTIPNDTGQRCFQKLSKDRCTSKQTWDQLRSHREHRGSSTALNYAADSHTQHRGRAPDHTRQVTQTEVVRRQLS